MQTSGCKCFFFEKFSMTQWRFRLYKFYYIKFDDCNTFIDPFKEKRLASTWDSMKSDLLHQISNFKHPLRRRMVEKLIFWHPRRRTSVFNVTVITFFPLSVISLHWVIANRQRIPRNHGFPANSLIWLSYASFCEHEFFGRHSNTDQKCVSHLSRGEIEKTIRYLT